jgi:hypothetical protein
VELSEGGQMFYSDDNTLKTDSAAAIWCDRVHSAMSAIGRTPVGDGELIEKLEKAGFVDIQAFTLKQPFGPWAKDLVCESLSPVIAIS